MPAKRAIGMVVPILKGRVISGPVFATVSSRFLIMECRQWKGR